MFPTNQTFNTSNPVTLPALSQLDPSILPLPSYHSFSPTPTIDTHNHDDWNYHIFNREQVVADGLVGNIQSQNNNNAHNPFPTSKPLFAFDISHSSAPYYLSARVSQRNDDSNDNQSRNELSDGVDNRHSSQSYSAINTPNKPQVNKIPPQPNISDIAYISSIASLNTCTIIGGKRTICALPYTPHSLTFPNQHQNPDSPSVNNIQNDNNSSSSQFISDHSPIPFHSHLVFANNRHTTPPRVGADSGGTTIPQSIYFPTPGHTSHLAFQSSNSGTFCSSHLSGHISLHHLSTGQSVEIIQARAPVNHLAFGPGNNPQFASCLIASGDQVSIIDIRQNHQKGNDRGGSSKTMILNPQKRLPKSDPFTFSNAIDSVVSTNQSPFLSSDLVQNSRQNPFTASIPSPLGYHVIPTPILNNEMLSSPTYLTALHNSSQLSRRQHHPVHNYHTLSPQSISTTSTSNCSSSFLGRMDSFFRSRSGGGSNDSKIAQPRVFRKRYPIRNHLQNDQNNGGIGLYSGNYPQSEHNGASTKTLRLELMKLYDFPDDFRQLFHSSSGSVFWSAAWNPYDKDYEITLGGAGGISVFDLRMGNKEIVHFNPTGDLDVVNIVRHNSLNHDSVKQMGCYPNGLRYGEVTNLSPQQKQPLPQRIPSQKHHHGHVGDGGDGGSDNDDDDDDDDDDDGQNYQTILSTKIASRKPKVPVVSSPPHRSFHQNSHRKPIQPYTIYSIKRHKPVSITSLHYLDNQHIIATTHTGQVFIYTTLWRQQEDCAKNLLSHQTLVIEENGDGAEMRTQRQRATGQIAKMKIPLVGDQNHQALRSEHSLDHNTCDDGEDDDNHADCSSIIFSNSSLHCGIVPRTTRNLGETLLPLSLGSGVGHTPDVNLPIFKPFFDSENKVLFVPRQHTVAVLSLRNLSESGILYDPIAHDINAGLTGQMYPSHKLNSNMTPVLPLGQIQIIPPTIKILDGAIGIVTSVSATRRPQRPQHQYILNSSQGTVKHNPNHDNPLINFGDNTTPPTDTIVPTVSASASTAIAAVNYSFYFNNEFQEPGSGDDNWIRTGLVAGCADGTVLIWK